jgi:hypothetical protein
VPWRLTVGASLLIAAVFTLIWPGAPTYDPWAWIIWGREIIEGDLVTNTGPSWKPLPMFFTVPFALFGEAAPDLWLWIARATALIGIVTVAQLGARVGGRIGAALAALAITTTPLYFAYGIQGSSEGMLVATCCLAASAWLDGNRTASFWWLVAASLLRPEIWPFVALLALERLRDRPARFWWVGGAGLFVLACWLIPEKIGSGAYLRAATRANEPNPDSAAFAASPTLEVLGSMGNLMLWLPAISLALTLALGLWMWRRDPEGQLVPREALRVAGLLALWALAWVAIVAAMTEGGYAGNPRYLAAPLGLLVAVAMGGLAWLCRVLALRDWAPLAELAVIGGVLVIALNGSTRLPQRSQELLWQATNRIELRELHGQAAVQAATRNCQPLLTHPLMIPPVAWTWHRHVDDVEFKPEGGGGTFIIGRNIARSAALPGVPREVNTTVVARTSQISVVKSCGS